MAMATKRRHGQSASLWLAIAMEVRRREEISGVERHLEEGSSSTPKSVGDESTVRRREPEKGLVAQSEARGPPRRGGRRKDGPSTTGLKGSGSIKGRAGWWRPGGNRFLTRKVPQDHPDGPALTKKARDWPKRERRRQRSKGACTQREEVQADA